MNQQEAAQISRALKRVETANERQQIMQAAIEAGLREVPEIDTAMEVVTLNVKNFGEASGRELAVAMILYLTKTGYYSDTLLKELSREQSNDRTSSS